MPEENDLVITFHPSVLGKLPISPLEDALKEGKRMNVYLPSKDYIKSVQYRIDRCSKRLKENGIVIARPDYKLVIGKKAPGSSGKLDKDGRVIIQHHNPARLG